MKNALIIIAVALTGLFMSMQFSNRNSTVLTEESGIQFHEGSIKEALDIAKKENKIIFVDIYASWCGPCKRLKKSTFSDAEVGDMYNRDFVNLALDAEKGEGIAFASKYNVRSYPTLLFINPDGSIVKKAVGYHTAGQFIELGKSISN